MRFLSNFIEGKRKKYLGYITWKCLIDYLYASIITDVYGYLNHIANFNFVKLAIGWLFLFVFVVMGSKIREGMLKFSYEFLTIMSLIPTLTIWWVSDENTLCFLQILLYWIVWGSISILLSRSIGYSSYVKQKESGVNEITPKWYYSERINNSIMCAFIVCMASTLFFSYKYGAMRVFVGLQNVYEYRLASGNSMSSIEAYWYNWMATIILPIILVYFMLHKKIILSMICCLMISMNYSIYGNKCLLFMILLAIGISVIHNTNFDIHLSEYVLYGLNIITFMSCILEKFHLSRWGVALMNRMTTEIAKGHFYYYDFFQTNQFLYLRQSIFRFFASDPYGTPIGTIIGSNIKYNLTGDYNNFNNGVFSDAYANFGIVGVIIYPILFVITIYIFEKKICRINSTYSYLVLCWLLLYCMSIGYFQWLLSGGLIFALMIFRMFQKQNIMVEG